MAPERKFPAERNEDNVSHRSSSPEKDQSREGNGKENDEPQGASDRGGRETGRSTGNGTPSRATSTPMTVAAVTATATTNSPATTPCQGPNPSRPAATAPRPQPRPQAKQKWSRATRTTTGSVSIADLTASNAALEARIAETQAQLDSALLELGALLGVSSPRARLDSSRAESTSTPISTWSSPGPGSSSHAAPTQAPPPKSSLQQGRPDNDRHASTRAPQNSTSTTASTRACTSPTASSISTPAPNHNLNSDIDPCPHPDPPLDPSSALDLVAHSRELVQQHIRKLTRYNAVRDAGLELMGIIADARSGGAGGSGDRGNLTVSSGGQRLRDVMADFGIEEGD